MVDALAPDEAGASSVSGATAASPGGGEQRQRLEQAHELLLQAQDAMNAAQRTFQEVIDTTASVPASSALQSTRTSVDQALVQLEALRRLFFSVVEHLQDAARRQQELADETEALAALDPGSNAEATARQVGPIGHRQGNLAATTEGIGEALRAQASTSTAQPALPDGRGEGSDRERLTQAAELITGAGVTMNRAAERLADSPPLLDQARSAQDQALNGLLEAIALLQQQQDQAGPQDGDQSQSESGDQAEQQQPEPEQQTDLGQLLQSVRDREAQRREDRARNRARQQGYEPVEKDW
jgi:hypothetical protein